jgi:hypothetical protein
LGHHFLHRPECRTWLYPWSCPDCASAIFVYQCTCGSGVFFDDPKPPWPLHDCGSAIVKASMAGAGGWLKAGLDPATGKGTPLEALEGFVATGKGVADHGSGQSVGPSPPVFPAQYDIKAMDPMPGEAESFIGIVRDVLKSSARLDNLYDGLGDVGRKMLNLPPKSAARQITLEKNDLDPVESYTAVLPAELADGVSASRMVWVSLEARHAADRSAWLVADLGVID